MTCLVKSVTQPLGNFVIEVQTQRRPVCSSCPPLPSPLPRPSPLRPGGQPKLTTNSVSAVLCVGAQEQRGREASAAGRTCGEPAARLHPPGSGQGGLWWGQWRELRPPQAAPRPQGVSRGSRVQGRPVTRPSDVKEVLSGALCGVGDVSPTPVFT